VWSPAAATYTHADTQAEFCSRNICEQTVHESSETIIIIL
jgi:hypothetical protein